MLQAPRIRHPVKSEQDVKVLNLFNNDGRRGTCEEHLKRYMSRGRRNTRDISVRYVGKSGNRFPDRGCILKHQIVCFGQMILREQVRHFV